ncbi:MAG TPA: hypothetical protein VFG80_01055 [Myxococcota bacterium]|nr:hypothetical protein [Myxococcota bacterium]
MRAYQVFASLPSERAPALFSMLREKSPLVFQQALAVASAALKARPVYLAKQPFEKQAEAARRALARVAANLVAEEVLASYFLQCQGDLLVEWLDSLGLAHEKGTLAEERPAEPPAEVLRKAVEALRAKGDDWNRELLLRAFAAQEAIDWPALDELLAKR